MFGVSYFCVPISILVLPSISASILLYYTSILYYSNIIHQKKGMWWLVFLWELLLRGWFYQQRSSTVARLDLCLKLAATSSYILWALQRSSLCLTYIYNMLRCVSIYRSAPPPPTTMSVFTVYRIITHSLCAKADLKVSSAPQLPPGIYRSWQQLTVEILRRAAANIVDNQGLPHSRSCKPSHSWSLRGAS